MDVTLGNQNVSKIKVTVNAIDGDFAILVYEKAHEQGYQHQKIYWPLNQFKQVESHPQIGEQFELELKPHQINSIHRIVAKAKNENSTQNLDGMRKLLESLIN